MKFPSIVFLFLTCFKIQAQDVTIHAKSLPLNPEYSVKFNHYELFEIDLASVIHQIAHSPRSSINLDLVLGNKSYLLQVDKFDVIRPGTKVRVASANGIQDLDVDPSIETYRGYNSNFRGRSAAITIAKNYLNIMFQEGEETYYFEQVPVDFKNRNLNQFVLYDSKGYKVSENFKCSAEALGEFRENHKVDSSPVVSRNQRCWEMEIALAADNAIHVSYGNDILATEARLTTIVNLMQVDWLVPIALSDYIWTITTFFVAADLPHDPWRNAGSINQMLTILSNVAPSIFIGGFDVGVVWTDKFNRGTPYAASQSGMCTFSPYAACSEFTRANGIVKSLLSHTIGHTMSAVHDGGGSPTIMSPNIAGYAMWSNQSQFDIYAYAWNIKGCLVDCSASLLPVAEFKADTVSGCIPMVVKFTNMSSNGTNYKWSFPGGTPSTSIVKDPIITYNSLGVFTVELVVLNPKCSTKIEKIDYIEVKDKPRNVTITYGAANNGNEIEFFANSDRADTYKWKFHDGTTEEGDYVIKTYPKEGAFDVELCAYNDCGETCVKQKIGNYYIPLVDFTSDTMQGCAPTTIKFFDKSSPNVIAWTWSFPGGNPTGSFIKNPIVKYSRPGRYQVKLVVNSLKNNAQLSRDTFITIDSLPLADFSPNIAGPNVDMNNKSSYAMSHFWDFGDGKTSTDSSPTHIYKDGRYEIKYTATNKCGSTKTSRTITIGDRPTAGFSVKSENGCIPYVVQFENTSTSSAKNFNWSFPGAVPSTSTDKNPIVTYNSVGKYDVKLVVSNGVESDSITRTNFISVNEGPTGSFQHSVSGFVSYFTNNSVNSTKYFWDFGDGSTSTSASPSHNYGVEGEFIVRLFAENECGVDTIEKLIAVYLIPKVNFTSDVVKACAPYKVKFKDLSSVDVLEWNWQFEGGNPAISSMQNPVVSYDKAGKYTVKLSVKNSNGTNSSTKLRYLEIISPVKCPVRPPKKTSTSAGSQGFSEEDQLFFRSSSKEHSVNIYPNPSSSEIFIEAIEGTKYSLISLTGIQVKKGIVSSSKHAIDIRDCEDGSYFLKIDHPEFNEVIKIIISK